MKIEFTNDEAYQLIKLYDLLRDTSMIDDLPEEIESAFDKIQDEQVNYQRKVELAQSRQPSMEWDDDFYDSLSEGKDQPQPVEEVSTTHRRKDMDLL